MGFISGSSSSHFDPIEGGHIKLTRDPSPPDNHSSSAITTESMVKSASTNLPSTKVSRLSLSLPLWENNELSSFSSPFKRIENRETSVKTDLIGCKVILTEPRVAKPLAQGACKQIWTVDKIIDKVFLTAIDGNKSAQRELEDETSKALKMRNTLVDLNKDALYSFLAKEIFPLDLSKDVIGFLSIFPDIDLMKKAIETAVDPHPEISGPDLIKLKDYFNSPAGTAAFEKEEVYGKNLAIDLRIVPESEKINGLYTVEAPRADGDLESFIRKTDSYDLKVQLKCASDILLGTRDMHKAGYTHGDPKLDNILVTKKGDEMHFAISDWGKAEVMTSTMKPKYHVGNTRNAPWENRLSLPGDICSLGIMLIRLFEQKVLAEKRKTNPELRSLIDPEVRGMFRAANNPAKNGKVREGFEVFVIENRYFNAIEANQVDNKKLTLSEKLAAKIKARATQAKNTAIGTDEERLKHVGIEKDRYIDALVLGMKELHVSDDAAIDKLGDFIKSLTHIVPNERPTIDEAITQWKEISHQLESGMVNG